MRAILHVGDMKCGSKSIQGWLAVNEPLLREHGFHRGAVTRHTIYDSGLACHALDDNAVSAEARREHGIAAVADLPSFRRHLQDRLAAEVAALPADARAMLFSHELLLCLQPPEVERLIGLLRPLFSEIRVVAYIRRQDRLFLSLWGQRLKTHDPGPHFCEDLLSLRRYRRMLGTWEQAVGRDNLAVRIFDRKAFLDGDLLADFRGVAGIPAHPRYRSPSFANESLEAAAQCLLLELRDRLLDRRRRHRRRLASRLRRLLRLERRHPAGPVAFPDPLATFLWKFCTGSGLRPARAWAERIVAACDAENEEIRLRYRPDRQELFDRDFTEYPPEGGSPGEGYTACAPDDLRREPCQPPEPADVEEAYRLLLDRRPTASEIAADRRAANIAILYASLLARSRAA